MPLTLNGSQSKQLAEALTEAFPREQDLAQMVKWGLSKNLYVIAGGDNVMDLAFNLLVWVESRSMLEKFIVAARDVNPDNVPLRQFAEQVGLAGTLSHEDSGKLERIVVETGQFTNVETFRERMSQRELAVCRVEYPSNTGIGTGFLVGPDVLITNYHVVARVIANPGMLRDTVVLRFDYKTGPDGATIRQGPEYGLQANDEWLIDYSPVEQLDYALLRVKGMPGKQPVGGQQGAPERGWLTPQAYTFQPGEPVVIIQHPKAHPLQITLGAVSEAQTAQQRVVYSANTVEGSSGSPCFNSGWEVAALHHYGATQGNRGVLFSEILKQPKVQMALGI